MLINLQKVQIPQEAALVVVPQVQQHDKFLSFDEHMELQQMTLNVQNLDKDAELQNLLFTDPDIHAMDLFNKLTSKKKHPKDYYLSFRQIVENAGYVFDSYKVVTEDGYHLTMFRIRNQKIAKLNDTHEQAPVVFLQHGLMSSADCWLGNYADTTPALQFARDGYDVWLGNNRGNMHSRHHDTLKADKNNKEFYNFDFQDLGDYDLPAQIEYVRKTTGQKKLTYVGHSQGTSQMFYALTKMEESFLKDRINLFVAMAPVLRIGNTTNKGLRTVVGHKQNFEKVIKKMGLYEGMGAQWLKIVDINFHTVQFAYNLASMDQKSQYNDAERLDVIGSKFPQPASWKQLTHYAQFISSGQFAEYDYGHKKNNETYGQIHAPEIDVSKISHVPIAMFVGKQDDLATPKDTQWARDQIKTTIYYEELDNFDHGSFMLGKDMSYMDRVLQIVKQQVEFDKNQQEQDDLSNAWDLLTSQLY